jgi:hypothetical protein
MGRLLCRFPKPDVAGSTPVSRSSFSIPHHRRKFAGRDELSAWRYEPNSNPRIVPVEVANRSSSIPRRCSTETNKFGSG